MTNARQYDSAYERQRHDGSRRGTVQAETMSDQRSLSELFSELSRETSTLLRQEVHLARVELKQRVAHAGRNVALLAAGGLVLYAGILGLMITAMVALANVMEPWLATLIVALVVTVLGGILLAYGYSQLKEMDMVPRRTVETLQENAEWLKQELE